MHKWLMLILLLSLLTACGDESPLSGADPTPTLDFNTLTVDTGIDVVAAEGQIVPLRQATLSLQASGRVAEILVTAGDEVTAGQPLLRLEAAEQLLQVAEAETAVSQAEVGLVAAQNRLASAETAVQSAALAITAAEAQRDLLLADPLAAEIAAAEARIAAAEAGVSQAAGSRSGQLRVDPARVSEAEASVAAARAERDLLQLQYDDLIENEILGAPEEETRLQLQAAEANLMAAQTALQLAQQGATGSQQRVANAAVGIASAQQETAVAQLNLLQAAPRPAQIRQAEVQIAQAEAQLAQADVLIIEAEVAIQQAETAVVQAETALAAAQTALDRMTLHAPFAGTVATISARLGEMVSPGQDVLIVADMSGWLVKTTDLTELSVVAVGVGLPVTVEVDAFPNMTLIGRVTDIASVSGVARGDVVYEVTIRLDEVKAHPLRWGMTAFVNVAVGD